MASVSLVVRADERRRVKSSPTKSTAPNRRPGRGSVQEWPLL
jgi:hypothetical protein